MGQQGDDELYGGDGDDILIGGSNVRGALDGRRCPRRRRRQRRDRRRQRRDLLPTRRPRSAHARAGGTHDLRHDARGDDGRALVVQGWPTMRTGCRSRCSTIPVARRTGICRYHIELLDHDATLEAATDLTKRVWGNDRIAGGAGDDEIFGQLGADMIQGDGTVGLRGRQHGRAVRRGSAQPRPGHRWAVSAAGQRRFPGRPGLARGRERQRRWGSGDRRR
jgi:Ca2+-binding RTX toxin-like protein